jgi:hypothetical protein
VRFHFEMSPSCNLVLRCHLRARKNYATFRGFASPVKFLILHKVLASGGFCRRSLKPSPAL